MRSLSRGAMAGGSARVLMYSHDTFGLGHLTRTLRIARALRARAERVSILILSGSPVAPYMALPPGADLVKMPSVVKVGRERYAARDLEINFSRIKKMRANLIRSTALSFRPHLFLVDNVPLGMKKEVLPTLRVLRESLPDTQTVLILRDILDAPEVIRENWEREGVPDILRDFYDRIFVLGDSSAFDAVAAYGLPAEKTKHVGYGAPGPREPSALTDRAGRPRVLLTAGGGGDGLEFLSAALEGLAPDVGAGNGSGAGIDLEIFTGPLMDPDGRRLLHMKAEECGAELYEFVPDLPQRMRKVDLVVAMAGYNTCCEILTFARSALLVPRVAPRVEQLLRCQVLEKRGLASFLLPEAQTPAGIRAAVKKSLVEGPWVRIEDLPKMDGLSALAAELELLARADRDRPRLPRPAVPRKGGAGVPRRPVWYWPGGVFLLLLMLLLSRPALAATSWGGTLALGWDWNLLQSSHAEADAFGTASPDYWFQIDRLDDARGVAGLWGQWDLNSFYKTLRVKAEYRRTQAAHNPITALEEYGLSLRQKLPRSSRVDFSVVLLPQAYLRHRVDKTAGAGDPRFRPEAYRGLELELGYTRPVSGVPVTLYTVYEGRRETRWFRDRDRRTFGAGVLLTGHWGSGLVWKPLYEFDRTRSRHSSPSMSDYSSYEHAVGLQLVAPVPLPGGPWEADGSTRWKFRSYTTDNPAESSRYDRTDRSWWWNVYARRPFRHLIPFVGYESSGRRVHLPVGADASDEEGDYDSGLVQAGVDWEF